MRQRNISVLVTLSFYVAAIILVGSGRGLAVQNNRAMQAPASAGMTAKQDGMGGTGSGAAFTSNKTAGADAADKMMKRTTPAERQAAADRAAAKKKQSLSLNESITTIDPFAALAVADYFNVANYANTQLPAVDASGNVLIGTGVRKFVDSLPGLGRSSANNLGQYIPVAIPDTTTYPGSDYYEISLVEYTEKMHSDLPPTKLRGYMQTNTTDATVRRPHYLGPIIIAHKDRPVRVKFSNRLPIGASGDLFIPVDTTVMGAGIGPNGVDLYKENRASLHLHGGATPWISDGTPHQWTTPASETTPYPKGVSVKNVPDMPSPGRGAMTFFYTNQQSARLMFYHDHTYGMTRLNVYAGEAAGYLLDDPIEKDLVARGIIPSDQIPLVIQDKTYVPPTSQLLAEDPTWDTTKWGTTGSLWFPHVYMPNQNPNDPMGVNAFGRWDYGPWFWPPVTTLAHPPVGNVPATPNPSLVPESFMDTPVINGTAYPYLKVQRKAYRFRILNASNDRTLNLQLYYAKSNTIDKIDPATGRPLLQTNSGEVNMVPAVPHPTDPTWPTTWPTDGRDGGVPDPAVAGPKMIQIGTEGGFLPAPVVLDNTPVGYNYNRRDIVVLNVSNKTLMLGPAERADVVVDFSQVPAGSKLILYNDAPAPVPASDPRYDYYTGNPDLTSTGGAPSTLPGYGPNTRTLMQFQVSGTASPAFDVNALNQTLPTAYSMSQEPPLVPQAAYGPAYGKTYTDVFSNIQATSLTFSPAASSTPLTIDMKPKAIQELFELEYGRMNATLGVEMPFTNFNTQTTIPLGYKDPVTETIGDSGSFGPVTLGDGTQIWKITHNGVDTHAIHFHLFNVQLINRVGWDGMIRPPDANELGWKETIRMNPLEDCIVALRPVAPSLPFVVPNSTRPLDPTMPVDDPLGVRSMITVTNPADGNPITIPNAMTNFGWEYVWHCHLLGHEENDMMRPLVFQASASLRAAPAVPTQLTAVTTARNIVLAWQYTSNTPPANAFVLQRATDPVFSTNLITIPLTVTSTTYTDTTTTALTPYYYRVRTENSVSHSAWSNMALAVGSGATVSTQRPTLLSPLVGYQQLLRGPITFSWNPILGGATGYGIELLSAPPENPNGTTPSIYRIGAGLSPGGLTSYPGNTQTMPPGTYWWRVIAIRNNVIYGVFSDAWSFTVPAYQMPVLISPVNAFQQPARGSLLFTWNPIVGAATGYTLELLSHAPENPNGTTPSIYRIAAVPSIGGLPRYSGNTIGMAPGTYWWRVIATQNSAVFGVYSNAWSFSLP